MKAAVRALILAGLVGLGAGESAVQAEEPAPQPGTTADAQQQRERHAPVGRAVDVITSEEIWSSGARNLPELLQREAGLWMTFVSYAGGTPVVRGLTGNDVLIVLDGMEVNNTAYRFGPLEYLSTIDLHLLDRIEIVRGGGGGRGGSTHGPVIHLYTRRDARSLGPGTDAPEELPRARAVLRYSTVDKSTVAHLQAHDETERYSFLFGATSRDLGDLRGGDDTNFQRTTAYEETSGHTRLQYFLGAARTFDLDVQITEQTNVGQFNRIQHGSHIAYRLNPRKRELFRISYLDATPYRWAQRVEASVSLNQQRQKAYQQTTANPEEALQSSDNNDSEVLLLRFESAVGERHDLSWGLEHVEEKIGAVRKRIEVLTGEQLERGRDPTRGGQSRTRRSLWVEDRLDLHPRLDLAVGLRYSVAEADGTQETPAGTFDLLLDESTLSGFVGLGWQLLDGLELTAALDRGSRLPGIDEVTGFTDDPLLESLPADDLAASTVDSLEVGLRYQSDRLRVDAAIFRQRLDRLSLLQPATVDGLSFADLDGDGVRSATEPAWVRSAAVGASEIDGVELDLEASLPWGLRLEAFYRASEGDDLLTGAPLAAQPPDFGRLALGWQGSWRWKPWAEAVVRWADDVSRPAQSDLASPDFDPLWLDSHDVFELRAGVSLPPKLRLLVILENPSDEDYKRFGSALAGPGRNLVLSAEYVF